MSRTFRRRNAGKPGKARDGRPHDWKCRCEYCEGTRKHGLDTRRRNAAEQEIDDFFREDVDDDE